MHSGTLMSNDTKIDGPEPTDEPQSAAYPIWKPPGAQKRVPDRFHLLTCVFFACSTGFDHKRTLFDAQIDAIITSPPLGPGCWDDLEIQCLTAQSTVRHSTPLQGPALEVTDPPNGRRIALGQNGPEWP